MVFAGLAGEPFGLSGSRRLLYEMHTKTTLPAEMDATKLELVLDIGSVGRPQWQGGLPAFYLHTWQPNNANTSDIASGVIGSSSFRAVVSRSSGEGEGGRGPAAAAAARASGARPSWPLQGAARASCRRGPGSRPTSTTRPSTA